MGKSTKRRREAIESQSDVEEDFSDLERESSLGELDEEDVEETYEDDDNGDDDDDEEEQVEADEDVEDENEDEGEEDEGPDEEGWGRGEVSNEEEGEEENDEDEQNESRRDAEMEELEKEYMDLRHQEQDILKNLKRHRDEDVLKGQAVKNQKVLWDKTLEFRFLLQKVFSSSNRLPQEPVRSSFCDSDEGVSKAYADLIAASNQTLDALVELQEALLEQNPSVAQSSSGDSGKSSKKGLENSNNLDVEGDKEWLRISQLHRSIAPFRDKSIDKWQRKTQVTSGAAAIKGKLQAFNQSISEQVGAYMRDPSRMIKQMQQRRPTVGVYGDAHKEEGDSKTQEAQPEGDPELLDDADFYQQLLSEFLEAIDPNSSEAAFYAFKRFQVKRRKVVDRRASKSRKLRYNVHEKIISFMASEPIVVPDTFPKLSVNLFGLKTQNPAPVV